MQITNTNSSYQYRQPSFGSGYVCRHWEENIAKGKILHFTAIMRDDFLNFGNYILELTQKLGKPVKILDAGCSDGSEAYRIMMEVNRAFKNSKFIYPLPEVKAFDMDEELINIAKSGRVNIEDKEFQNISKIYGPDIFTEKGNIIKISGDKLEHDKSKHFSNSYKFKDNLFKHISFYVGNLESEFSKISNTDPSVVVCRYAMQYNSDNVQNRCANLLSNRLKPDSMIVISARELNTPFAQCLNNDSSFYRIQRKNDEYTTITYIKCKN